MSDILKPSAFRPSRRSVLAGGAAMLAPWPSPASAQGAATLNLRARSTRLELRPGSPPVQIPALDRVGDTTELVRGQTVTVNFTNELPSQIVLNWIGMDTAAVEPLVVRKPVAPGASETFSLTLEQAGTYVLDLNLLTENGAKAVASLPLIVRDGSGPELADRDETILIENWRTDADGAAADHDREPPTDAQPIYTVNRKTLPLRLSARRSERIRFRFINGCQRTPIAIQLEGIEPFVIAIDSTPADTFPARDGKVLLAPATRIDVLADFAGEMGSTTSIKLSDGTKPVEIAVVTISNQPALRSAPLSVPRPLAADNLPAQIDLKRALRVGLSAGNASGAKPAWNTITLFKSDAVPAFQVKRGRPVVLAITNAEVTPAAFRLHGHHFRLLDRLDDGWKPFWLDTLLLDVGQTHRIAFVAERAGRWLMETTPLRRGVPKLLTSYIVE